MRIGLGYDIHPLVPGRPFVLGGITIEWDKGPQGHSDGDCLYHAVADALLGALALGDMGKHFPDTDPRWKGAHSEVFVRETARMVREKGYKIANLDANILLEKPKLALHIEEFCRNLSALLEIPLEDISVKAKRGEGLDAVGRGEAVAAQVAVLLS